MNVRWSVPNIGLEEFKAVEEVLESGWLSSGRKTEEFEKLICDYTGAKYAVVMNNGTSCLIASLIAHGIGKGDEVIVPSFTFISSINSILAVGAKPVLVDSDKDTWNTTAELMESKITSRTKAIMPVDVGGLPVDINAFSDLANDRNLVFIEDSAEALGAEYIGKRIGGFDHTSIFSFHMAKQVSCIEGGSVTTNDFEIAEKLRKIRNHGSGTPVKQNYNYVSFGLNLRISDLHSAIGVEQMKKLPKTLAHRANIADRYKRALKDLFVFQQEPEYSAKNPYMFFGMLDIAEKRDKRIEMLLKNNIDVRICWLPAHSQPYHTPIFDVDLPVADQLAKRMINLPMGNGNSMEEVEYVVQTILGDKK